MKNQNGSAILVVVGIIAIVGLVGGMFYMKNTKQNKPNIVIEKQQSSSSSTESSSSTSYEKWMSLLTAGKSLRCTVIGSDKSKSEILMKGKKMKMTGMGTYGDTQTKQEKEAYVVNDSQYTYMWNKGEKKGIKIKNPTAEEVKKIQEKAKETLKNMQTSSSYNQQDIFKKYEAEKQNITCKIENITDNEFVPPTNISFTDPTEMVKEFQKTLPSNIPVNKEDMQQFLQNISSRQPKE